MNGKIEAIIKKREQLNNEQQSRYLANLEETEQYLKKLQILVPRMQEMWQLASAMLENGFSLGKIIGNFSRAEFYTEGVNHKVGFYAKRPYYLPEPSALIGFGIMNGGWNGSIDFVVDKDGNILERGAEFEGSMRDLRKFVDGFDKFYNEFMDYVDKTF